MEIEKQKPNFDTTYCRYKECPTPCWRHVSNFDFEEGKLYWYMDKCEKVNPKK